VIIFGELETALAITSNRIIAKGVPSSPIFVTLMMEVMRSSETPVLTRATLRNIPEGRIRHIMSEISTFYTTPSYHYEIHPIFVGVTNKRHIAGKMNSCSSHTGK
jgi:hypothetical protein